MRNGFVDREDEGDGSASSLPSWWTLKKRIWRWALSVSGTMARKIRIDTSIWMTSLEVRVGLVRYVLIKHFKVGGIVWVVNCVTD